MPGLIMVEGTYIQCTGAITWWLLGNRPVKNIWYFKYRHTSNISRTYRRCSNYIFVLDTWLQWVGQIQLQDERRNIWTFAFGAIYTRGLGVNTIGSTYSPYYITPKAAKTWDTRRGWLSAAVCIPTKQLPIMMTKSNGNISRITGHLCGEFTDHRRISRTKASDAERWCFLWSAPE